MGTKLKLAALLLSLFLFIQCGIVGEGDPDIRACLANPFILVNDPAKNDSLNFAFVNGMQFYIVPGANYSFIVDGSHFDGSKLYIERVLSFGTESYSNPIIGTSNSAGETYFNFESISDTSELVWGITRNTQNGPIFNSPDDVKLVAEGHHDDNSFGINYHFLGKIPSLPNDSAKQAFRNSLHSELKDYFSSTIETTLM